MLPKRAEAEMAFSKLSLLKILIRFNHEWRVIEQLGAVSHSTWTRYRFLRRHQRLCEWKNKKMVLKYMFQIIYSLYDVIWSTAVGWILLLFRKILLWVNTVLIHKELRLFISLSEIYSAGGNSYCYFFLFQCCIMIMIF